MAKVPLQLPQIQNWSCHNCSGCCRQHRIEITKAEKQRIENQKWTAADGIPADKPLVERMGRDSYRLAHQPDGACVFLGEDGLCRIHAKFGEEAKPLACRVYPYTYHPAGKKIAVSLRFSCPSAVRNLGTPVREQSDELQTIAKLVVPKKYERIEPPPVHSDQEVSWSDIHQFIDAAVKTIRDDAVPLLLRLLRLMFWTDLVEQSAFERIRGDRLTEYLELIPQAAVAEVGETAPDRVKPGRLAGIMFRLIAAQFARKDTQATLDAGLGMRMRLGSMAIRITAGIGSIPPINPLIPSVKFSAVDQSFGPVSEEIDAMLSRYLEVKLRGVHFCGSAHYDWSLVEGLRGLTLMYPVVLWMARAIAVADNRKELHTEDVVTALTVADHNYGFSPGTGAASAKKRVELLAQMKQITKLCVWYGQ